MVLRKFLDLLFLLFPALPYLPDFRKSVCSYSLNPLMVLFQSSVLQNHLRLQEVLRTVLKRYKASNTERSKEGLSPITSSIVEMPQLTKKDEFEWMELFD